MSEFNTEDLDEVIASTNGSLVQMLALQLKNELAKNTSLTSQLESVVAENAALKAICDDRRTFIMNGVQLGYIQVPTVETDPALETIRVAVSPQEPTPATSAFLAEVRAQGVEMFASVLESRGRHQDYVEIANAYAAQLRKGVQS